MDDNLRTDLNALADRAMTVDLTDRTHATARRLRAGRATFAGVAVLAVAGGVLWGSTALPQDHDGTPPAASIEQVVTELKGRLVFTRGSEVVTWTPGHDPEVLGDFGDPRPETYRFSPDGGMLSFLDGDGELHVHDLVHDQEVQLPEQVAVDADGDIPVWAPDSRRLWIDTGRGTDRYGFFDIASGDFNASQEPAGRDTVVVRAPDGDGDMLISLRDGGDGNELVSVTPDGEEQVLYSGPLQGSGEYVTDILTTDVDGSRMCLNTTAEKTTDPADHPTCNTLLKYDEDAAQNTAPVAAPRLGWIDGDESEDAKSAALIADSGQRVQQFNDRAVLVTGVDKLVDEVRLPDELRGGDNELVAYQL